MKKIITILAVLAVFVTSAPSSYAKLLKIRLHNPVDAARKEANIPESALIAVSFKELSNPKEELGINADKPMNPASIQKLATIIPALDTLGENYEFSTKLYKNQNNDFYLKLSADPFFTTSDLKNMIRTVSNNKISTIKTFNIDDSVMDGNEWGEGWQWDDDLNPLMPKFSAYNIDKNLIDINICPTEQGAPADISLGVFYPTAFVNNITTADKTDIKLERKNYISPDVIDAEGTISRETNFSIPTNHPRRYFIFRLEEILRGQKISYYGDYKRTKLPKNLTQVAEIKRPISPVTESILKNSNNMMAETIFKVAGGKYAQGAGSTTAAVDMFKEYYQKQGINTDVINIVDGSGVSKNNLITADFMTNVLISKSKQSDFETFKSHMATPGEGTLTDRMLYFKGKLWAKTGTLSNISSLAGYLTTKSGKTYAFCIIVNDPKSKSADKKAFEEYVLRKAYDEL